MDISTISKIKHTESGNFFLLAGPCAIEGEEMALRIAEKIVSITDKLKIPRITSYNVCYTKLLREKPAKFAVRRGR